jgi:hypothetical protein
MPCSRRDVQDLLEKQLVVGDTGPGTGTRSYPKALNDILGMKFRIVGGYPSSADVFLAMERGEVQSICESVDSVCCTRDHANFNSSIHPSFANTSRKAAAFSRSFPAPSITWPTTGPAVGLCI